MARLSDADISAGMAELSGWRRNGDSIVRDYRFPDFAGALEFVNRVAAVAERANHHPDIDIRYNNVRLVLTSHDSGGITERDLRMAKAISAI